MGVDLVLLYDCRPRRELGAGNVGAGTHAILDGVKAQNRAEMVANLARKNGQDLDSIRVQVAHNFPGVTPDHDRKPTTVGYRDLLAGYDPLRPFEPDCDGCPANASGVPFGCSRGFVNYPVPPSAEEWIADRLQPPGTVGGHLLFAALRDFNLTGEPLAGYRKQGLLAAPAPAVRAFDTDDGTVEVRSDQVLEAIFCVGEPLNPGHVLGVLLWLGALTVNGEQPGPADVGAMLAAGTPDDREAAAAFDPGEPSDDAGVYQMQRMLYFLYRGWVTDSRVWVDA